MKADIERELRTLVLDCRDCGRTVHWVAGLGVTHGPLGPSGAHAARRARRAEPHVNPELPSVDGEGMGAPAADDIGPPSEATGVPWLYAERRKGEYPQPTRRSGKWLVYVAPEDVDDVWAKVRRATEAGRLGHRSKVATGLYAFLADSLERRIASGESELEPGTAETVLRFYRQRARRRVICVYTYDWKDEGDVMRVRSALRRVGVAAKIAYKADQETRDGVYRKGSHGPRVGKYFA